MGFNPLKELLEIHQRLSSALDSALVSSPRIKAREALWSPSSDILRTKDALLIHVEIPGTPQESIRLVAEGGSLRLSGKRPCEEGDGETGHFRRLESERGEFRRTFDIPPEADLDGIESSLESGVLTIRIPLKSADVRSTRIDIE